MSLVITTKDLVKTYRNRTVVDHVSINVNQGEIVGLLGPNGAGKTTTFYMVVGLIKPDEGEVFLNTEEITMLPMYKRAQMGIGYLPQEASIFRKLSVEDNIMAVLEMTNMSKQQRRDRLEGLLEEFNLRHVRKNNGDSLSGGERRRTEIARALAVDPKFILLDEPFAGVDPIAVEDIQSNVARLKYKNIGILITDHNVNETLSICDRAYLLIEGKIFKHGTAEQLAEDEQVRRLYLGTNFELRRKDWIIEMGMKEHAKAPAVLAKDRTIQYLSDYIIEIDKLSTLSGGELQQRISERDFFKLTNEVLNYIKEYGSKNQLHELAEYTDKIKDLKLEQQLKQSFLDNLTNTIPGKSNSVNDTHREEAFKKALKDERDILEKIRLLIANPAYKEVLSE